MQNRYDISLSCLCAGVVHPADWKIQRVSELLWYDSHMAHTTGHMNFPPPTNSDTAHLSIISPDWDFKEMGIGGLDKVGKSYSTYV